MKKYSDFEAVHQEEHNLLVGMERPRNALQHQMILAKELFIRDHQSERMNVDDRDFKNRVMNHWVNNKYAEAFGNLIKHPDFKNKTHYRLDGNFLNITLSDIEYFLHNNELPER